MAKQYDASIVKSARCEVTPITENIDARYLLQVELHAPAPKKYQKTLTYVMMNPSAAEELTALKNFSDETVNKVIAFANMHQKTMGIGKVNIVNLFGVYEPQGKSLQKTWKLRRQRGCGRHVCASGFSGRQRIVRCSIGGRGRREEEKEKQRR